RLQWLNPWRDRARLELAALDAYPASRSFAPAVSRTVQPEPAEPAWVTVGLVDPDRWWVVRRPAGPDPARAERRCAEIGEGAAPAVAAEALKLRADLAGERWDFGAHESALSELVAGFPASGFAAVAIGEVGQDLASADRAQ